MPGVLSKRAMDDLRRFLFEFNKNSTPLQKAEC